jgi:hypothetical protein
VNSGGGDAAVDAVVSSVVAMPADAIMAFVLAAGARAWQISLDMISTRMLNPRCLG